MPSDAVGGIRLTRVTFGYSSGADPVVDDLSVSVNPGESLALVGESGSGKSTLLYLMGLFLRPTSGELTVFGTNPWNYGDRYRSSLRSSRVGFVFQDACLDERRSILDNVLEPTLYRSTRSPSAADDAAKLLRDLGVTSPMTRRPTQLSGGQMQRVALARALAGEPVVVLADEPTGNLDLRTRQLVVDALFGHVKTGAILVIATHDLELAALSTQQVRIS
ncbi:MAG: ATP-binding cassette domain-containing protein [Acidimicrobiales bacterium]|nr:ATP-binding cassette domain-containing protein [Acidimicrobiales bacterium]